MKKSTKIFCIIAGLFLVIVFNFGMACLATWAVVTIAGIFGCIIEWNWLLVFAIWVVIVIISTIIKRHNERK